MYEFLLLKILRHVPRQIRVLVETSDAPGGSRASSAPSHPTESEVPKAPTVQAAHVVHMLCSVDQNTPTAQAPGEAVRGDQVVYSTPTAQADSNKLSCV